MKCKHRVVDYYLTQALSRLYSVDFIVQRLTTYYAVGVINLVMLCKHQQKCGTIHRSHTDNNGPKKALKPDGTKLRNKNENKQKCILQCNSNEKRPL